MSGGVDSSVAALLLQEQGYEVIGLFMKNWEELTEEGFCQSAQDFEDVIKVCEKLNLPYYSVNLSKEYWDRVFTRFLEGLQAGRTPNPDILCNREIKFKAFLEKALALDADYIATGHYCQTQHLNKTTHLLRGADPEKDQSYFLYSISQSSLQKSLFPIGRLEKREVRSLAQRHCLPTAEKRDSTGICFIGKRPFAPFLSRYIKYSPGMIKTLDHKVVGEHRGIAFYTLGQRKGLNIGGSGAPWFVVDKDRRQNVLFVAQGKDHPSLFSLSLTANELTWLAGFPPSFPISCTAKVRYRHKDVPCTLHALDQDLLLVTFEQPQRAITEGQSVVFYKGPICLGGGIIEGRSKSVGNKSG